jgi:hypothetical protein
MSQEPSPHMVRIPARPLISVTSNTYLKTPNRGVSLQHLVFVIMAPGHIPAYLFAVLITSFCYGRPKSSYCRTIIKSFTSGIAVTLFFKSVATIVRKRRSTGKFNLSLVIPSALIFLFATLVSVLLLGHQICFETPFLPECHRHMDPYIHDFCGSWQRSRSLS